MNLEETLAYLDKRNIRYDIVHHKAVYNMEEASALALPWPDYEAKNLFVRDDKKRNWYLITVKGDKRVDLKQFRREHGTRPLSFASAEDLQAHLCLTPGSVTPLGLLNDETRRVVFWLDEAFLNGMIGVHPNDNTASILLKTEDLITLLKEHGTPISITSF